MPKPRSRSLASAQPGKRHAQSGARLWSLREIFEPLRLGMHLTGAIYGLAPAARRCSRYFGDVFIPVNFDFPSHMRSPLVPRVYVCLSRFLIARVS